MSTPRRAPADPALTRAPARRGHGHPGCLISVGLAAFLFALLIITLQTQTNEAHFNGTSQSGKIMEAQWGIWLQIPRIAFGDRIPYPPITSDELPGIVLGQGIELTYLMTVTGFGIAVAYASKRWGQFLGLGAIVFLVAVSIFDFYTDYAFGNTTFEIHAAYAILCTVVVGFFPTIGLIFIGYGWRRL